MTGWKKGSQPKFDAVVKIASYFHVDIRYLLGMSDVRYGEDMIEEVTEYINDIECEVHCYEDENGSGREYVIENDEGSMLYQEHEYRDLCQKILTEINTAKFQITENIIQNEFEKFTGKPKAKENSAFEVSEEERSLIEKFRQLDEDGRIMLQSTMIAELRRMR